MDMGWKTAASATLHCLTGCAIGEVLGMILSTAWGWSSAPSIVLSVGLAFLFGYGLTIWSLRSRGLSPGRLVRLAFASDTVSIAVMEITDNGFVLLVPGAIHATLSSVLFWWSLTVSLLVAFLIAWPVNRWLIARGKGHAAVHEFHHSMHNHDNM
jgi:hypothetical protein